MKMVISQVEIKDSTHIPKTIKDILRIVKTMTRQGKNCEGLKT